MTDTSSTDAPPTETPPADAAPAEPRWRLAANTSTTPVIIDDDGRSLGGGEYGSADTESTAVTDAIARRVLVFPSRPPRHAQTPAGAAQREVDHRNRQITQPASDAQEGPA